MVDTYRRVSLGLIRPFTFIQKVVKKKRFPLLVEPIRVILGKHDLHILNNFLFPQSNVSF